MSVDAILIAAVIFCRAVRKIHLVLNAAVFAAKLWSQRSPLTTVGDLRLRKRRYASLISMTMIVNTNTAQEKVTTPMMTDSIGIVCTFPAFPVVVVWQVQEYRRLYGFLEARLSCVFLFQLFPDCIESGETLNGRLADAT